MRKKWLKVLKPEMMSSEESEEAIVIKPLPYWSSIMNKFLDKVDESIVKKTPHAKRQRKSRVLSDIPSQRPRPTDTSIPYAN